MWRLNASQPLAMPALVRWGVNQVEGGGRVSRSSARDASATKGDVVVPGDVRV